MSTISQLETINGLLVERFSEYEVPLYETLADQFHKYDIIVFCSTFTNISGRKAACTSILIGKDCVYSIQKSIPQPFYHDVAITEILSLLHTISYIKLKHNDKEFKEAFQIEEGRSIRIKFVIQNFISKKSILLMMRSRISNESYYFSFLLGLIIPVMSNALSVGIQIDFDYDFTYPEYPTYCNYRAMNAIATGVFREYRNIVSKKEILLINESVDEE